MASSAVLVQMRDKSRRLISAVLIAVLALQALVMVPAALADASSNSAAHCTEHMPNALPAPEIQPFHAAAIPSSSGWSVRSRSSCG
jgi:hypothetical protein